MKLPDELSSRENILKTFDPRTDEGLPFLAALFGFFAILVFVLVVFNALAVIVNWNPITWLLSKLPGFILRTIMALVTIISSTGALIGALALVKVLHLLHRWRHQAPGD